MELKGARTAGLALAIGAAVAAGCGGDDGPSREEFVESANAICERHTVPIREAAGRLLAGGELPDPREFMELAQGTIIPEYSAQLSELEALEAPDELSEEYQSYLEMSASTREEIMQDPSVITNPSNFEEVNRQAEQLGFSSDCRVGPG
ncbi:MAG: hypothetical protein M3356_07180 [Actinomycetota bacterium]|nr:hypothetical protein [Actinomycetota bacterium]